MPSSSAAPQTGRPAATTHADIERIAFGLFEARGFNRTRLEDIARATGVGQRTLSRYYPSKADIPWGQFDQTLAHFRSTLASQPRDEPLWRSVHRAVVDFNQFPDGADPPHAARMRLILRTPALQAHSVHRYAEWRLAIAEHVARRTGRRVDDLLPRTVGHTSLALALVAYEMWLPDPSQSLTHLLDESMSALRQFVVAEH